jgi:hypothetical protein
MTKLNNTNIEDITILYPGAFKPIHGAHIDLIKKYLTYPNVKKIVLFISPSKRDEITSKLSFDIANNLLSDLPVDIIIDNNSYSPILACYRWIENKERTPGNYALASSNKDEDYKRVKEFTKNYSIEKYGKNLPAGVNIIELPIDTEPLTYSNGEPISASRIRHSLLTCEYQIFKESYPNINEDKIKQIWNILQTK